MKRNSHIGSTLDALLREEGLFKEVQAQAIKEVIAWQLGEAMRKTDFQGAAREAPAHQPKAG